MLRNNLLKPTGNTLTGVAPELYLAPKAWFLTIATAPNVETTPGFDVIITSNHIFLTPDLGFVKLELTDRTGMIKLTQTGELDSESIMAVSEGYASGLTPAMLSFMAKPFDGIVLQKDPSCATTRFYQIGTACSVARKKGWEAETGTIGEGRKGIKVRFEAIMEKPLFYAGVLTLATQPSVS